MFFLARSPSTYLPPDGPGDEHQPVVVPITDATQALPWFVATYQVVGPHTAYWETVSCTEVTALVQHLKRQLRLGAKVAHLLYLGPYVRNDAWFHWKQQSIRKIEAGRYQGAEAFVLWQGWTEEWVLGLPALEPREVTGRHVILDLSKATADASKPFAK